MLEEEGELHADEIEAARNAREEDPAGDVRRWLLEHHVATLCTTSVHRGLEGYPFGSVVPFALDARGLPIILIARIATHYANLDRDPRGSLFVRQPGLEGDPQVGWRITLMGTWERVEMDDPEREALHARYVQRVPFAEGYLRTHDFFYWRMKEVRKVRYIGGFGKICWVQGQEILRDPASGGIGEAAPGAIEHMNEDHAHNLVEMCEGHYNVKPQRAVMTHLERDGFFVRTEQPDHHLFFPFGKEIGADELRPAVIDVLAQARRAAAAR